MSHSVQMPALGESVTEGTVTRWLKKEGDHVTEDEPLVEVSTDKVDTEVPAPYSGVLEKILVHEDETVGVGADLAIIGDGSSGAAAAAPSESAAAPAVSEPAPSTPQEVAAPPVAAPIAVEPAAAPPVAVPPAAPAVASTTNAPSAGTQVTMPAMGESVTEGTITRWLKNVGDSVAEDEPIVEIATDKVDAEVPSPVAGTLLQILAAEDATVEVGAPLAVIGDAGAIPVPTPTPPVVEPTAQAAAPAPAAAPVPVFSAPAFEAPIAPVPTAPVPAASTAPVPAAPVALAGGSRSGGYVTPVVRKIAADNGVDLDTVVGTGVGGRIRREDVLAAALTSPAPTAPVATVPAATLAPVTVSPSVTAPTPATQAPASHAPAVRTPAVQTSAAQIVPASAGSSLVGTIQPAPRIRQAIARSMMHAVTTSAQTTTIIEIDASRVEALRGRVQARFTGREGIELTLVPFFVKAAIEAAKANPIVNASLSDDLTEITYHAAVHLGLTVDTPRGQITPVIHHADDLNVTALARYMADLADRAGLGQLDPNELSGATLTVSNAGSPGALIDTPIVVPPQAATLALGSVAKRPVVITDSEGSDVIAVRSIATIALSFDQRFVDGSDAGRYLSAVKKRIEDGDFEADLGV